MNLIAISGNLVKDNEVKYTSNNKAILENVIAVRKGSKNKTTGQYESDFISVVFFDNKAEYLKNYSKKGDKVEVSGKIRIDNWRDDKGEYHSKTYVVADTVQILSSTKKEDKKEEIIVNSDDLPF